MSQVQEQVSTRSTKVIIRKDSPTSGATFNFQIKSLSELEDPKKIDEQLKYYYKIHGYLIYFMQQQLQTENSTVQMKPPVYVKDDEVYYDSNLMKTGESYEIEWKGEKWALKKTSNGIDFMKWESDSRRLEK